MAASPSGMIQATLNYFLDPKDGGTIDHYEGSVGEKRRKHAPFVVDIKDIRGREKDFTLDSHGFQLVKKEFTEQTFDDEDRIREQYYPEVADLVKRLTGATKVVPGQHVVRRQSWISAFEEEKNLPNDARSVGPSNARWVHCDLTFEGARERVKKLCPEYADKLHKYRWATINVWKPFDHPVTRDGLCFADPSSIRDDELRTINLYLPSRRDSAQQDSDKDGADGKHWNDVVQSWQCAPPATRDQHKWYYASEMRPDEVLLLKISDSKKGVADKSLHTSFTSEYDHGPERHSIEVRCRVIWEDESSD
ncbi:unnamed protein product [Cercospora beticola]|nr:unnamed protein product [Cercospora beticola]